MKETDTKGHQIRQEVTSLINPDPIINTIRTIWDHASVQMVEPSRTAAVPPSIYITDDTPVVIGAQLKMGALAEEQKPFALLNCLSERITLKLSQVEKKARFLPHVSGEEIENDIIFHMTDWLDSEISARSHSPYNEQNDYFLAALNGVISRYYAEGLNHPDDVWVQMNQELLRRNEMRNKFASRKFQQTESISDNTHQFDGRAMVYAVETTSDNAKYVVRRFSPGSGYIETEVEFTPDSINNLETTTEEKMSAILEEQNNRADDVYAEGFDNTIFQYNKVVSILGKTIVFEERHQSKPNGWSIEVTPKLIVSE